MQILSLISYLLDYPQAFSAEDHRQLSSILEDSSLRAETKSQLDSLLRARQEGDILELQSEYESTFERGRTHALWLFEHVHGESRDRGQAMVDLLDNYRQAGLEISQNELPDYIPLFLEFLATQGEGNAKAWLEDVEHILALLQCRLEKSRSDYAILFAALLEWSGSQLDINEVRNRTNGEQVDNSPAALDKEWEEQEVSFSASEWANNTCSSSNHSASQQVDADQVVPVHWVDFNTQHAGSTASSDSKWRS